MSSRLLAEDGSGSDRDKNIAVNQALKGKINSVGTVTLTANAASTTVTNPLVGDSGCVILLFPQTANAAAALATTYIATAGYTRSTSFVITHANNAQVDKTFSYVILG
jgi:hypothetical protein